MLDMASLVYSNIHIIHKFRQLLYVNCVNWCLFVSASVILQLPTLLCMRCTANVTLCCARFVGSQSLGRRWSSTWLSITPR